MHCLPVTIRISVLGLGFAALAGGCYESHRRPPRPDAGDTEPERDAGVECAPGDIEIDAELVVGSNLMAGLGSLVVDSRTGETLFRDGHTDHGFRLCFAREHAPLDLSFTQQGGHNYFPGISEDFRSTSWGRMERIPLTLDPIPGRLVRQEEGSEFVVHFTHWMPERIDESPFMHGCRGVNSDCRIRFIELSVDGELLGAGAFDHRVGWDDELVLDARGADLASGEFEVRLPSRGLLAGVELAEVRPLDCTGDPGPLPPGAIDLWRCTYAGVGHVATNDGERAVGSFSYSTGPVVVADTLMARLGSEEEGFEAYAFVPCCRGTPPPPIRFGEVTTLEGVESPAGLMVEIDAPGYEHPFIAVDKGRGGIDRIWSFAGGLWTVSPDTIPQPFYETRRENEEVWVGAITTSGAAPWAAGVPVMEVRRRIVPSP